MTLLDIKNLKKHFPVKGGLLQKTIGQVKAVDGVSLQIQEGETIGIVGESGCGKSTLGRAILKLHAPTAGEIHFNGQDISDLNKKQMRPLRRDMQIIFQDPFFSLNPRHSIGKILEEPLIVHKLGNAQERREKILQILDRVGMAEGVLKRYPHEFSGGQRQRIGIARALVLGPKLIIADEPVSALDVSIQSQILNLLRKLQDEFSLTYMFISHDLAVVEYICDHVAVMYLGKVVEYADNASLFSAPKHPYTKALLSAIPQPDPTRKVERIILEGDVPSPINPPSGCRFHTRCPLATEICKKTDPDLSDRKTTRPDANHKVACHHA